MHFTKGEKKTLSIIEYKQTISVSGNFPNHLINSRSLSNWIFIFNFFFTLILSSRSLFFSIYAFNETIMLMVKAVLPNKIAIPCYFTWKWFFTLLCDFIFCESNKVIEFDYTDWLRPLFLLNKHTLCIQNDETFTIFH